VSVATETDGFARKPHWSLISDGVLAGSVAAFALWTLMYEGALVFGLRLVPVVVVWLILGPVVLIAAATYNVRRAAAADRNDDPAGVPALRDGRSWHASRAILLAIPVGVAGATLMALTFASWFVVGWALGVIATVLVGVRLLRSPNQAATPSPDVPPSPDTTAAAASPYSHVGAAVIALVLGIGSLFLLKADGDDAYYVNLSTWIAEHGRIPLRDTMFGNQVAPTSYGGGIPVSSIEALIGALARLLDVRAGTMAYLVLAPICAIASIWVLWQLAQLLAPRRPFTTFLFSVVFIGVSVGAYGSYSGLRIWQGKVIAIAVLVPLIWVYAVRLLRTSRWHWSLMVLLAGIAFLGLTSSAAIQVPVLSCSFLLAGVLLRRPKLWWGAVLLVVAPAVSGLVLVAIGADVGGLAPVAPTAPTALDIAFGSRPALAGLSLLVLMFSPLLLRDRGTACLVWCSTVGVSVALAPGVFGIVNSATGAGPVAWRMLLGTPLPTLVGLVVATTLAYCVRWSERSRAPAGLRTYVLPPVIAVALVCLLGIAGKPAWTTSVRLADRPVWKVDPESLANVKAVLATKPPKKGPLLLPPAEMRTLAIYTTHWFAVVPRDIYVAGLPEPAERSAARYVLLQLVAPQPVPSKADVKWALGELGVQYVCLERRAVSARRVVSSVGYEPFVAVGTLMCAEKSPT
jgi:hypothetical protein